MKTTLVEEIIIVLRGHAGKLAMLFLYSMVCGVIAAGVNAVAGLVMAVIGYAFFCYIVLKKKAVILLIAAALLSNHTAQAQQRLEPAAPYILGGLVLIVGAGLGYVGCKAVKACKKIGKSKGTNSVAEHFVVAGESGEYGAAFFWGEPGVCYEQRLTPTVPTAFTISPVIDGTNVTIQTHADTGYEFIQSWGEFTEDMAQHGLVVPGSPVLSTSYEINRHPCEAHQVPIKFDAVTHVATVGAGGVLITVDRSDDLKTWETFLKINIEPTTPLRIEDAGDGKQFYRITTSEP